MIHLMVFDDDDRLSTGMAGTLSELGYHVTQAGPASGAGGVLKRERAGAVVVRDHVYSSEPGLAEAASGAGIPVVVVVDDDAGISAIAERLSDADDWVRRGSFAAEFPARVNRLLKKNRSEARPPVRTASTSNFPADPHFFALVVHDLRTPLNVIGLSLRMVSQSIPKGDPDLDEDMRFIDENFHQMERMLSQLSDYYRLFEEETSLSPTPFSPRRMVDELLESRGGRLGVKLSPLTLDIRPTCPQEVNLDPSRARQAIQYALVNASTAANGQPIRLTLGGDADRWVIEVSVSTPAPASVNPVALSSMEFERLCGIAAERRGMDLAIAAKVTEMFGGSARLDVDESRATNVVLEWPARQAAG